MHIEHIACNVELPRKVTQWYTDNLEMHVVRHDDGPTDAHFLADATGRVMLEVYHNANTPVPEYASRSPFEFHIAFAVEDIQAVIQRLLAAGATSEGETQTNPAGDELAMLRDPWGIPVQLVKRSAPMS